MNRMLSTTIGKNGTSIQSHTPLTNDQIFRVAPSIFAQEAHDSRSDRYAYIPTSEVLQGLRNEGLMPFFAAQATSRIEGKTAFTKHMIRLRHVNDINKQDGANEVILVNSHDGSSAYQLLAGYLRFVCQNGMVAGDIVENHKVRHTGSVQNDVIDVAYKVLDDLKMVDESREGMMATTLNSAEQNILAKAALGLRFGYTENGELASPVAEWKALSPNRTADQGNDLWRTFNRVQENLIKGGMRGRTQNNRRTTTREVQSVDGLVGLNRAMWTLAEEMKRLHDMGSLQHA